MIQLIANKIFTRQNMAYLILSASTALGGALYATYADVHAAFCTVEGQD